MMGIALAVTIVGLIICCRKRGLETERQAHEMKRDESDSPAEEDDILAVITAVIAEFESGGDFKVFSIRPSARTWTITSRQEQLCRHL